MALLCYERDHNACHRTCILKLAKRDCSAWNSDMPITEELSILILAKAYQVLPYNLEECMCVAGITSDNPPRWVRLYPVFFYDLDPESRFRKYQWITVSVRRPKRNIDTRAETWEPILSTITLGETIGTEEGWARLRVLIEGLGEPPTMCALNEAQNEARQVASPPKTGDQTMSLFGGGYVQESAATRNSRRTSISPVTPPSLSLTRIKVRQELLITPRNQKQINKRESRARAKNQRLSLFAGNNEQTTTLESCPWKFQYQYECLEPNCRSHKQSIIDWEIMELWSKVKDERCWRSKIWQFEGQMWEERDTMLIVGNQVSLRSKFQVLSVFGLPTGLK